MSFTYGGTNTESLAGVTATLTAWPSLGGLDIESEEIPGRDGRYYADARLSHATFVFDVIVHGATVAEVSERRDAFVGALDPSEGPRPLVLETDSAWRWPEVMVSEGIEWKRGAWDRALGFTLRADVTLETQGKASAFEAEPEKVELPKAGSYTLESGNTSSFPRIEFAGGAACAVKIGSYKLNISKTPSGSTVVLDWSEFEFFIQDSGGKRTASAVPNMSNYKRPTLRRGKSTAVSVTRGGSAVPVVLYPNARRI
ncbi:phage tail domain-containing protein [Arthrobacter rhombi]|uniref:phage tail domain-containing protein n=1 Tax=Arthrobacter rhombi TaxID=71253 RepID=UPI003FD22EBD